MPIRLLPLRFAAGLLGTSILAACAEPPDTETAIREWLARGEAAVEVEDRRALMRMVADDYADARGNRRDDVERLLLALFLRQDNVRLLTRVESVDVFSDTAAEVRLTAGVTGINESMLGFSADALRFELELEHDGNDWQLMAARWGELGRDLR